MTISKLSGSQTPLAPIPLLCGSLILRVLLWLCTQPSLTPGLVGPHLPITPGAVPLHLAPRVPQPYQLHFLILEQGLEQREKTLFGGLSRNGGVSFVLP